MSPLLEALSLQAGYNVTLVMSAATLLGFAAGATGTFLFLRRRALVSDGLAHATLPGVGLAFLIMVSLGGDGRNLIGLLVGSALTAGIGLYCIDWIVRHTRLTEDAAIGAILSVFFGLGVVLLTVIQTLTVGKKAGLESFLLGATAGMIFTDAVLIALGGAICVVLVFVLRRAMTVVAFDAEFAASYGIDVRLVDIAIMGLVLAVAVTGLKMVGLILIIALLIIPPVTARFWTDRTDNMIWISGATGALAGYCGTAISAALPSIPTGPIVVLVCTMLFVTSLLFAPNRGVLAALLRYRRFQLSVHRRQGLLALARGESVFDALTITVLRREKLIRSDGVLTPAGRAQAAKALRDEKRWEIVRQLYNDDAIAGRYDGLTPIEDVLTKDEIQAVDDQIGPPRAVQE